jgi:hypothetical protein
MSDDYDIALSHLEAHVMAEGVGVLQVTDGQIFMFSREFLGDIMKKMDEENRERVVVFVKRGPILSKETLS